MKGFLSAILAAAGLGLVLGGGALSAGAADSGPPVAGTVQNFEPLETPRAVPDTGVRAADGSTVTFDAPGELLIVNFWATWCGPCVRELPALAALAEDLPEGRARVVLVSQDRGGFAQTDRFLARHDLEFAHAYVDERLQFSRAMEVRALPTTILIAADGRELGRLAGPAEWDDADARALIDWYLDNPPPPATN